MALLTDDIIVDKNWTTLTLRDGGTFISISGVVGDPVLYTVGDATSTSTGITYKLGDFVKSPESIRVRASVENPLSTSILKIVRDGI